MPYLKKDDRFTTSLELDTSARILQTVQKQIEHYSLALDKIRMIRKELMMDKHVLARIKESPESMAKLFVDRGIPSALAYAMAAEDFGNTDFDVAGLTIWTWDCCCTGCCITCIGTTNISRSGYLDEIETQHK